MIEKISWASYATALLTIVVIYYLVIVLLYYKKEFFLIIKAIRKQSPASAILKRETSIPDKKIIATYPFISDSDTDNVRVLTETSEVSSQISELDEKIKRAIVQYAERQYIQKEIITGLRLLLKEYPQFRYSAYTASINNIMIKECETHCSIRLEDDEVKSLWM